MSPKLTAGKGWSFEPTESVSRPKKIPTGNLAPDKQDIWMKIENRSAGKVVTLIGGLILSETNREALAKELKNACGTGGTVREGKIELQGDQRDQAKSWFIKKGWKLRHGK